MKVHWEREKKRYKKKKQIQVHACTNNIALHPNRPLIFHELVPLSQVDGAMKQDCDSRLFLLDISDPKAIWREGLSLPGDCGVGQTMDTVIMPNAKGAKV